MMKFPCGRLGAYFRGRVYTKHEGCNQPTKFDFQLNLQRKQPLPTNPPLQTSQLRSRRSQVTFKSSSDMEFNKPASSWRIFLGLVDV